MIIKPYYFSSVNIVRCYCVQGCTPPIFSLRDWSISGKVSQSVTKNGDRLMV